MAEYNLLSVLFLFMLSLFSLALSEHIKRPQPTTRVAMAGNDTFLSLPILYREFADEDYKLRNLHRLQVDQDRAAAIAARLQLTQADNNECKLNPSENHEEILAADYSNEALNIPIMSGLSQRSGSQYFAQVRIGQPPRAMYLVLDTGSDLTWLQCKPCDNCYPQSEPTYDPFTSSTYLPIPCSSQSCTSLNIRGCNNDRCLYKMCYGDKSFSAGHLGTETIIFEGSKSMSNIAFGCGHDNQWHLTAAGILALGGGSLSLPSQIQAKQFSYCLVDRLTHDTSTLHFGSELIDPASISVPLLKHPKVKTFYYINMTGISVNGEMLPVPPSAFTMDANRSGGIIVDSATVITTLRIDVYSFLRDAFVKGMGNMTKAEGVQALDNCYNLSARMNEVVPAISFHFPGEKELRLQEKNFLIQVDNNKYCLAFVPTKDPLSVMIIGNVQQQGIRVAFDLENSVVRFTPNKC